MSKKKHYEYQSHSELSREEIIDRRARKRARYDTPKEHWHYPEDYENEEESQQTWATHWQEDYTRGGC